MAQRKRRIVRTKWNFRIRIKSSFYALHTPRDRTESKNWSKERCDGFNYSLFLSFLPTSSSSQIEFQIGSHGLRDTITGFFFRWFSSVM